MPEPAAPEPTASKPTGPRRAKAPAIDLTTWETWWELARIGLFARYDAGMPRTVSPETAGSDRRSFASRAWPCLLRGTERRHAYPKESALLAMARTAASEAQVTEARKLLLATLTHRNHLLARCSALGLLHLPDEAAVPRMVEVARNPTVEPDVRVFLAHALASRGSPAALPLFESWTTDWKTHPSGSELAASGLFGLGSAPLDQVEGATTQLREIAFAREDVPSKHRSLAVTALGLLKSRTRVGKDLLAALVDHAPQVRRAALLALVPPMDEADDAATGISDAGRSRIRVRLLAMLDGDPDALTRRLAAIALGRLGPFAEPETVKALQTTFREADTGLREFALLGLALAGDASVTRLSEQALRSRTASTRGAGCIALGLAAIRGRRLPWLDAEARGAADARLRRVLADDANPYVRAYAALALGMIGEATGATAVTAFLAGERTPEEQAYAFLALGLAGRPGAASVMLEHFTKASLRHGFVAGHLIYGLGLTKERTAKVAEALIRVADDDSDQYRSSGAYLALGYLGLDQRFPRRHVLGATCDYTLGFDYLDIWLMMI